MHIKNLPSPGLLSNGIKLRTEAAKAISSVEVTAMRTPGGKVSTASLVKAFFDACSTAMDTMIDVTIPLVSAATAVAASATKITIDFVGTDMDESVIPLPAAFAITGDTITAVAWGTAGDAGKLVLTGTGFAAAETLVYTQPATNALRDLVGNLIATGSVALA